MSIAEVFNTLPDPRAANSCHKLGDLVAILIAAVLCGRKTATDIALFADINRERLRGVVDYNIAKRLYFDKAI